VQRDLEIVVSVLMRVMGSSYDGMKALKSQTHISMGDNKRQPELRETRRPCNERHESERDDNMTTSPLAERPVIDGVDKVGSSRS
jgi:hypothetical protein